MTATWEELRAGAETIRRGPTPPEAIPPPEGWPTIDPAVWHGVAGDTAQQLGQLTEADPLAVLASLLVAYGNLVGPDAHLTVSATPHPARLFACLVGDTAKARKGTSWQVARTVTRHVNPEWDRNRVTNGLSSGEGLIAAVRDPDLGESGEPLPGTGVTDKRLLVIEEEFARVLQVTKREASTLSAIIRAAYDSGDMTVLTKVAMRATGAHISILGHITETELRARLTDTDIANGFANRFIYLSVRRPQLVFNPEPLPAAIVNNLASRVAWAAEKARHPAIITRTPLAASQWEDMYRTLAYDQPPEGIVASLTARAEAHIIRLAVAYALADGTTTIDVEHQNAAWALWAYSRASVERIFSVDNEPLSKEARKLLDALDAAGPAGLSYAAQMGVFHRNLSAARLGLIRNELDDLTVTRQVPNPVGRPATVTWTVKHAPDGAWQPANEHDLTGDPHDS